MFAAFGIGLTELLLLGALLLVGVVVAVVYVIKLIVTTLKRRK